jgi:hypothetical protein
VKGLRPAIIFAGALNKARRLCTIGSLKGSGACTQVARWATDAAPLAICASTLAGCDPVINIAGADFPSWLLCLIVGAILTAVVRPVFVKLRLEPYLGPLLVVYLSLTVLLACATYLMFFNRI